MIYVWFNGEYEVIQHLNETFNTLVSLYHNEHSKMLVVRVDVRYPINYGDVKGNIDIMKCMAKVRQTFARRGLDPCYIWVREKLSSPHPHYHLLILLDGQKTRSAGMVFDTVERHWQNTIHSESKGLIDHCNGTPERPHENGRVINRSEGIPDYLKRQIDYISKPAGKGQRKDGIRDFGMSRLMKFDKKK